MCNVDVAGKNHLKIKVQTLTAVFSVDLEMLADLFKYVKNFLPTVSVIIFSIY